MVAELGAAALSAALFLWHNIALARHAKVAPQASAHGRHRKARAAWIAMAAGGAQHILVVQTLRNWIMSASLLASTAILFALALLGAAFTTDKLSAFAHGLNFLGSQSQGFWLLKALILILVYFTAFFAFSLSIRSFVHAGFMINVAQAGDGDTTAIKEVTEELESGAFFYWLGIRAYYASVPAALWLFGPVWMLLGTLVVLLVMRRVD